MIPVKVDQGLVDTIMTDASGIEQRDGERMTWVETDMEDIVRSPAPDEQAVGPMHETDENMVMMLGQRVAHQAMIQCPTSASKSSLRCPTDTHVNPALLLKHRLANDILSNGYFLHPDFGFHSYLAASITRTVYSGSVLILITGSSTA